MAVVVVPVNATSVPGLAGPNARSARVTFYRAVDDLVETATWQDGRYAVLDVFNRPNAGGTLLSSPTLDFGAAMGTFGQQAAAGTLDDLILMYWGP